MAKASFINKPDSGIKEEISVLEGFKNSILNKVPEAAQIGLQIQTAIAETLIRPIGGDEAALFFLGGDVSGQSGFVDPNTGEIVKFDMAAYKRDGYDAVENKRYYELEKLNRRIDTYIPRVNEKGESLQNLYVTKLDEKFKKIDDLTKNRKQITDEGVTGFIDAAKKGEFDDMFVQGFDFLTSTAMHAGSAFVTGGLSMFGTMTGGAWANYNDEKSKALYGEDDPDRLKKLIINNEDDIAIPAVLGGIGYMFERLGYKGMMREISKRSFSGKKAVSLLVAGSQEGTTEYLQGLTEKLNENLGKQMSVEDSVIDVGKYAGTEEAFDNFFAGLIGGTGLTGGGKLVQAALRADQNSNIFINKQINKISRLVELQARAKNKEEFDSYNEQLQIEFTNFKEYLESNKKVSQYLKSNEIVNLTNAVNNRRDATAEIVNLIKGFKKGVINKSTFDLQVEKLKQNVLKIDSEINKIKTDANLRLLKKDLDEAGEFVGDIKNLTQEVYETNEEFIKALEAEYKKQGKKMSQDIKKGIVKVHGTKIGNKILVNAAVAADLNAVATGTHEVIHAIVRSSLQADDGTGNLSSQGETKVKSFIATLSSSTLNKIEDLLEKGGYKKNEDGTDKEFKEYGEEYLAMYAQLSKEGNISKNVLQKAGDWFVSLLRENNYKKIGFEDGTQIKNFLDAYVEGSQDAEFKKISRELAQEGTLMADDIKESKSNLIEDINKMQKGAATKAEFQKPEIFNEVFKAIQPGGAINNYIRSLGMSVEKTQETIDAVTDRLINFDPAAKRKDGSVIGPKGLGEFIMANVGFAKLDAAKSLAKKAEKQKRTTKLDDPDVKDIADTPTTTEKTQVQDVKLRKLKDFNVNLDDGLADALTVAEVNDILDNFNNGKIAFEQAQKEIDKIVLKDIRAGLSKSIPKISKGKPTPEYEAFIRKEYDEIIQSLGIKTIRTSYKKFFTQEKTGVQDYKNIDPVTGKVSNYRKSTQINTTNKREFIKYFLEAKGGVLNERRTALIRRIAKRKASLAVDNYIEQNSNNIEAIVKAKIRTLSDTAENATNEQVSFDSVKFSKTFKKKFKNISSEMGKLKKPIDGFTHYYKPPGWKEGDKVLTFSYKEKTGKFNEGFAYEQAFAETLEEVGMNIKDFEVTLKVSGEEGGVADAQVSYLGEIENHEIKKNLSAFFGSTLINNLNIKSKVFTLANEIHNSIKSRDGKTTLSQFVKNTVVKNLQQKVEKINAEINAYNKKYGYKKGDAEFGEQITGNVVKGKKVKTEKIPREVWNKVGKELGVLKTGLKIIQNHYGTKGAGAVKSISIFGFGSFRLDPTSIFKGLEMLDVNTEVYASLRYGKSSQQGSQEFVTFKTGLQFRLDGKPKNTQNSGLITQESILEALGNPPAFSKNISNANKFSKSVNVSRTTRENKGITILDFDDTLATTKSLVKYTAPDGTTGTLNAEEYASTYQDLLEQGYTFDFSEFNKVVKGKVAPLFQKALKLQKKFGPENMFVLTARPAEAAPAIFDFLKANGLNIPLKNITGLANSTSEAKALWIAEKVGEGYNDFYFADDALQNVQAVDNMLEQFDVKRKVQQAKVKFSKTMNDEFNDILEDVTGIESVKRFDFIKARKRGASKGKFRFFVPPSHEDFVGLLYNFMGKGRKGDAHRDFLEKALVRPLNRANREYDTARQSVATDYKNLNKQMPDVKKKLLKKTPDGDFIYQDAIRVYLWDKHGYDIPGLSPIDQKNLVDLVKADPMLQSYAEAINTISRQDAYVDPTDGWDSGDIRMDLDDATGRIGRAQFFEEFITNADIIFSKENLNKIEAGFGKSIREALEDMLYRIKTGRNKPTGQSGMVNSLMNWVNGSVGSVMFFNMRSALLQQMSLVNYINFADNNIFAAAKAFANQKQYWADWAFIFNSDMLKQRRGGIQTDVNGAELAAEMRKSKSPHRFLISKLLQLGFLPTQIGDNIAIATGGATYYRNRINTYLKQGLSQKEAEAKAFTDFQDITQSTQQSARPDMVSQQQASLIGKIILNFQNVTSQFNRLGKKAFLDIKNRRITKPNTTQMQSDISNAARITYYFAVQNAIFYTLQTALFAMLFDDDEEDVNNLFLKKQERLINGSIDSVLRGTGIGGAVISTLKNVAIAFARQRDVNYNPDESAVVVEALNFSPVIGIKARKIVNAEKTLNYNKKVIDEMSDFDIDNPQWSAVTNYIEGFTNAPLNRLYNKTQNVRQGFNNEHEAWERALMFLGWSQYNLNLENNKIENIKKDIKNKRKSKKRKKITRIN